MLKLTLTKINKCCICAVHINNFWHSDQNTFSKWFLQSLPGLADFFSQKRLATRWRIYVRYFSYVGNLPERAATHLMLL